ncbi:hypothetical protein BDZ85DRAFT_263650 [Elsinoe ampelina]|uniref:Uncharacterized protein n=1 Tax=Elsinoe ampelina TaxID=302913 RepID=A0A6A6GA53_9PEZI|nr:hypothetical protein BDZ85DRAFT_263650 [Elsinoe ampelina]
MVMRRERSRIAIRSHLAWGIVYQPAFAMTGSKPQGRDKTDSFVEQHQPRQERTCIASRIAARVGPFSPGSKSHQSLMHCTSTAVMLLRRLCSSSTRYMHVRNT